MKKLTQDQIKEIAEELDCGFSCHYYNTTNELIFIPDLENYHDDELEAWADDLKKIKKGKKNFKTIDPPKSSDTFEIMVQFIKTLHDDHELRDTLSQALTQRKPFQEFKSIIDNSGDYRQKWFDFKNQKLVEWVKKELNYIDDGDE